MALAQRRVILGLNPLTGGFQFGSGRPTEADRFRREAARGQGEHIQVPWPDPSRRKFGSSFLFSDEHFIIGVRPTWPQKKKPDRLRAGLASVFRRRPGKGPRMTPEVCPNERLTMENSTPRAIAPTGIIRYQRSSTSLNYQAVRQEVAL